MLFFSYAVEMSILFDCLVRHSPDRPSRSDFVQFEFGGDMCEKENFVGCHGWNWI